MVKPGLSRRLLRCGFHLLYNQLAFSYDLVAYLVSFGQWAAWRRNVIPYLVEGPTLDLAFGTGGLLADLRARGQDPVGIDLSPYMGKMARRRLRPQATLPGLVQGSAQQLPFVNQAFANVIATFPAEFILSVETVLGVARVLQPGGRFLIVVKGCLKGPRGLQQLVGWAYQVTGQTSWHEESLTKCLNECGFQVDWIPASSEGAASLLVIASQNR